MGKFVLPGDYVANSAEVLPGFGLYSEEDEIKASNIGELYIDKKNHSAKVLIKTRIPRLQGPGVVTFARAIDSSKNSVMLDLIEWDSKNFSFIPRGLTGVLYVSNVRDGFVKDLSEEVKIGDILRVKISEVKKDAVSVTITERKLGVVKAFCSVCRHEMVLKGGHLKCPNCGNVEKRKTAIDYGNINVNEGDLI